MDLARLVPAEAIIGDQDGGHAEPAKGIVLDDCFAAGSEKKAPGFGAGHMAMLDEDTGRPVEIFDYVSEAGFPGNRPGEGDEQLSRGTGRVRVTSSSLGESQSADLTIPN